MTLWAWGWAGWVAYFVVLEGVAFARRRSGGTLSAHVWVFLGIDRDTVGTPYAGRHPTGWTRLRRFLVLAFLAWLVAHFLTGGYF